MIGATPRPRIGAPWLALAAGAALVTALPPLSWLPLLPLGLSLAYLVWNAADAAPRPGRRRFLVGWAFGVGHFAAGLYWVSYAFLVDAETYGWMIPFALAGLGAGLGLFTGLAFWLAGLAPAAAPLRWLAFAAAWTGVEWLRGWALTGFPWNSLGTAWAPFPAFAQPAAWIGMYGLAWLTVLAATAPAAGRLGAFGLRLGTLRGTALAAAVVAAWGIGGAARLPGEPMPTQPGVALRLVQPNIPQSLKWDPIARRDNLYEQVLLSRAPGWETATHVIWSETAATWPVDGPDDALMRNLIGPAAPPGGWLITGAPRQTPQGAPLKIWNSIVALSAAGEIGAVYDKAHLVPFGEYVPFAGILPVAKLTHGRVDFSPGPGVETERLPGTPPYSPLVCYEVIFPAAVADRRDRPDWLLNVTNDAWFGLSAGPHQHFASATLRAVEEGLPLVRAANTGISAVVDPYGRIVARLDLGRRGVLDAPLPRPLPPTRFAAWGNLSALALAAGALVCGFLLRGGLRRRS